MGIVTTNNSSESTIRGVRFLTNDPHPDGGFYFLYTPRYDFGVTANVTTKVENGVCTVTGVYTITNNGDTDFTITMCYIYDTFTNPESGNEGTFYIDKTTLDNPVTIPANSGVGQITYEIQFQYD